MLKNFALKFDGDMFHLFLIQYLCGSIDKLSFQQKMTNQDHIVYWLKNAERDLERAEMCFRQKDYVFCLFCLHLALEKICKAIWVHKKKENHPPRIHNLEKILRQTSTELKDEDWDLLVNMNRFNLEGRYPDYRDLIYKECTSDFTEYMFNKVKDLKICLLKKLQ